MAAVVFLLAAPMATAQPPAADEYSFRLPESGDNANVEVGPLGGIQASRNGVQDGVAGEDLATPSTLASASSLVGGPLVIGLVLGGVALGVALGSRSSRTRIPAAR